MNREMAIRRRINGIYNRREEDFPSLTEYNDYLEDVEDLIFNLAEGINVAETEAKVAQYQRENADQIVINAAKRAEEHRVLMAAAAGRPIDHPQEVNGGGAMPENAGPHTQAQAGGNNNYAPAPATGAALQAFARPAQPLSGVMETEDMDPEVRRQREMLALAAAGWSSEIPKRRNIEEAFNSLFLTVV
eukprot:jgi/Chlat1/6379/Chrsp44S05757